jgi:hypothetical protein
MVFLIFTEAFLQSDLDSHYYKYNLFMPDSYTYHLQILHTLFLNFNFLQHIWIQNGEDCFHHLNNMKT